MPHLLQLVVAPPVISTGTFVMVIRMLVVMCASCPDLAVVLLKQSTSPVSACIALWAIHTYTDTDTDLHVAVFSFIQVLKRLKGYSVKDRLSFLSPYPG